MSASFKLRDAVTWHTPQGPTHGAVSRIVTHPETVGGHRVNASPDAPAYEVRSDKSGKTAIHHASALKRRPAH